MQKKKLFIIALLFIILAVAAIAFLSSQNVPSEVQQEQQVQDGTTNTTVPAVSGDMFECLVNGTRIDYSENISIDTPIPTETRVSGVASDGSNVKLILRTTAPGNYSSSADFGMSYQNFSSGFDYSQIYSPTSASSITLNLSAFNATRITAEFSGDIYDGSNNKLTLTDCKLSVTR